ncbi:MAG: malonic semialdehyde reductase [Candidatus Puniceispirillum sp.]|nr:malonic semialdehyde reductase [Candidatus Puniceispirillum sp.]
MTLESRSLDLLFRKARTYHGWQDRQVSAEQLEEIYALTKMGPTSTNCCPARYTFVMSRDAKERLKEALMAPNVPQTMAAPVTVIMGYDEEFWRDLDHLSPQNKARTWFEGEDRRDFALQTAKLNATLQHGYFIMAARACGLDCGPMTGFDAARVDTLFFAGTTWRSQILCNIGVGDPAHLYARAPRLSLEKACQFI